jgi:hypothetical protein
MGGYLNGYMYFKEIWKESVDWFHVAPDRKQWWALVNTVEPLSSIKDKELLDYLHIS